MKRWKHPALLLAALILLAVGLAACQASPEDSYMETDAPAGLENQTEEAGVSLGEHASLQAAYDELQTEHEALYQAHSALQAQLDYHVVEMSELAAPMFALGTVEAHGLPLAESAVIGSYCDALVDIALTIRHGEELWSLVSLVNLAESMDTVGWVKWDDLTVYDPASMEARMTYPVRVKEGVVLRDEVRDSELVSDGASSYLIAYTETDDVLVHDSGGITYRVTRADLLYPSVQDGAIVWNGNMTE